jgi:ATP-dependent Clp protease, protease subunit
MSQLAEKSWTVALRAPATEKLEISVYDFIGQGFFGDGVSAKDVLARLSAAPKATEITLRINSAGGVVDDAKAMINLLAGRKAQGARVVAFVDGMAASSASYLTTVADHVTVASNAFIMFHQARAGRMGNAKDMADAAEMLTRVNDQLADGYASAAARRGVAKSKADFLAAMAGGDTYLDADQAIAWGLADTKSEPLKAVAVLADLSQLDGAPEHVRGAPYVALAAAAPTQVQPAPPSAAEVTPTTPAEEAEEQNVMGISKALAAVLNLAEGADDAAAIAAITALKSAPETNAAAARTGLEIERIVGCTGAEAIGAVRALKADQEALVTVRAELSQTKSALNRNAFDKAISDGRTAKKLTPHAIKEFTKEFDDALAKGESGDRVVAELQGFIRRAAPFAVEAKQGSTSTEGALSYNGKTYAQMSFSERDKLAKSDPELWRSMKTDHEAAQH